MADVANGVNGVNDLPVWARVFSNVVLKIGVPAAIAVFLVWSLAGAFTASLKKQEAEINDVHRTVAELSYYMRLICVNTARTDEQRNVCSAVPSQQQGQR